MSNLQSTLRSLADDFVSGVLGALRTASLADLAAVSGGRLVAAGKGAGPGRPAKAASSAKRRGDGGRRARRSSESVMGLADRAVAYVKSSGGNVAVSDIAKGLGIDKGDISRPLAVALQAGRIRKTGEKRLTRYFSAGGKAKKK